jgi:hypothetical protein
MILGDAFGVIIETMEYNPYVISLADRLTHR